jgi:hypothetical protein
MSEILCKQRGFQLEDRALILRNVHTLQIQMTMLYPRECRDTFLGLNADAAWSSRRVNGRTSKGSLDVGSAHPRAPCDSGHPCNFHCPTDVLHSSEISASSIRCSAIEGWREACVLSRVPAENPSFGPGGYNPGFKLV